MPDNNPYMSKYVAFDKGTYFFYKKKMAVLTKIVFIIQIVINIRHNQ
jgi:hypothetical protein